MVLLLALGTTGCKKPIPEHKLLDYPEMTISSEWLEFGELSYGDTEVRTFTIQNTGDLPMGVSAIYEGKGMEGNYAISWDPTQITCPETVQADTGGADEDGAAAGPPGPPEAAIVLSAKDADGNGRPEIDFGTVAAGGNTVQYLVIGNAGADDLSLIAVSLTSATAGFTLLSELGGTAVPAAGESKLFIQFDAATDAPAETQLVIVSNDPNKGAITIDLLANQIEDTGEPPDTDEPVDDTGDTGEVPDIYADIEFVLEKDCRIPVVVTFSPNDVDLIYGSVIVETKSHKPAEGEEAAFYADLDRTRAIVYLKGEGENGRPRVVVRPRTVDFGHVWKELEEVRYIEVANIGDGDLLLTDPVLDDNCDEAFTVSQSYTDDQGNKVLAGSEATLLEVTFSPTDTSAAYCVITVLSDDAENPEVNVQLQGNSGKDPENEPPTVVVRSPDPGYVHNTIADIQLELNIFDVNQPASSLLCKVKSAVQLSASVANCTPTDLSGHVYVNVPMAEFEPGVDTLLIQVIDSSQAVSYASVSIVYNAPVSDSDDDGDGFGDLDTGAYEDCNDADINSYPHAAEIYDGLDNDCDFLIDEGTDGADDDGDAFTEAEGDCDDADSDSYPGAPEAPDHRDNNCDGTIDEGTTLFDDDGDGYAEVNNDCNDDNPDVNPGGQEVCDNLDNDCNGKVDDGCIELNSDPIVVGGIKMSQTACEPEEQVQLSMFVYDADGQETSYVWTAGDNATIDNLLAATVNWTAPTAENVGEKGTVVQVYAVAQDEDLHQVWDFAEIAVYPKDKLYQQYVEVILVEPESNCSVVGAAGGLSLALAGLLAALRRRQ